MEGALKLKELSYLHAEGYAAGELKHGPIALIDEDMPVIVIAPHDSVYEKTVSNMQEVSARGGRLILIGDARAAAISPARPRRRSSLADMAPDFYRARLRDPGADDRLSYRRLHGQRCRPAAQPRKERDGGIGRILPAASRRRRSVADVDAGRAFHDFAAAVDRIADPPCLLAVEEDARRALLQMAAVRMRFEGIADAHRLLAVDLDVGRALDRF